MILDCDGRDALNETNCCGKTRLTPRLCKMQGWTLAKLVINVILQPFYDAQSKYRREWKSMVEFSLFTLLTMHSWRAAAIQGGEMSGTTFFSVWWYQW